MLETVISLANRAPFHRADKSLIPTCYSLYDMILRITCSGVLAIYLMLVPSVHGFLVLLPTNVETLKRTSLFSSDPSESISNPAQKSTPAVPLTPCTRICRYNSKVFGGQVCIGCFRETYEIGRWQSMSKNEKYYALLDAADRHEELQCMGNGNDVTTNVSREELMRQAEFWKSQA